MNTYVELIQTLSNSDYDILFEASYPYLKENTKDWDIPSEGNTPDTVWTKEEVKADFKQSIDSHMNTDYYNILIRDSVTNEVRAFHQGPVDDGTLHSHNGLFAFDSEGSRSWVHQFSNSEWATALYAPLGILRQVHSPRSPNFVAFALALNCTLVEPLSGESNEVVYRSAWGWDDYVEPSHMVTRHFNLIAI
jgi:hypothetical protein|tara:strand:+ start:955 stop:1530 length:576 start_codon:yes stop_codon:yes gene_type:complete